MGIPWEEVGAIRFFVMHGVGIMIEDSVQWFFSRLRQSRGANDDDRRAISWWARIVGYVWVLLWMSWTMPGWAYPNYRRSDGELLLPFSLIESVARWKGGA